MKEGFSMPANDKTMAVVGESDAKAENHEVVANDEQAIWLYPD